MNLTLYRPGWPVADIQNANRVHDPHDLWDENPLLNAVSAPRSTLSVLLLNVVALECLDWE